MGFKSKQTIIKDFFAKCFSTPTNSVRSLIITAGAVAAVMPAWRLVTALIAVLGAVVSLLFITATTVGLLWLVSNWRSVWRKFTTQVAESVNNTLGREVI